MSMLSAYDQVGRIIAAAFDDICMLAEEVGIDGSKLLTQSYLSDGCLLKGRRVPVISDRYKGRCYIFFKVFKARNGRYWPYLKLCTFKHGGVARVFNGWQWLKNHSVQQISSKPEINWRMANKDSRNEEDLTRLKRHQKLLQLYRSSLCLDNDHPWVIKRFPGGNFTINWQSLPVRCIENQLIVPIVQQGIGIVGFHVLTLSGATEIKRHYVMRSGLMKGGFIELDGQIKSGKKQSLLCEGLATGMSLSMVWSGKVYVALSANNLMNVRPKIKSDQIIFCYDDDQWSSFGNTGFLKSQGAKLQNDILCGPRFSSASLDHKPTDFNDLHQLEGLDVVRSQLMRCQDGTGA